MKIVQITTFFHPVTGGVESHVLNLSRELEVLGHEVEVLTSDSTKLGPRTTEKKTSYFGVKIYRYRSWFSFSYYHKFFPGIWSYLMKEDYDVIHVHGFRKIESYIAMLAGKLKKKPVVLTTHNPFPTTSRPDFATMLLKLHDITFGKLFVKKFDKIITIVPSERDIFTKKFGVDSEKIVEIPNGVEHEFYEAGDANNFYKEWKINPEKWDGIVVGVGRMSYAKGFQHLKFAIKKLNNVLFFFAGGDDGYLANLKTLYKERKNVIFSEKFISPEKQRDMYAAANVSVLPSLHEAFGMVIMESLAQGVPVIATDKGGPKEIFKLDAVKILDPEQEDEWKISIEGLVRNKARQEALGYEGKKFALQYSWDKVAKKIADLYLDQKDRQDISKETN